MADGVAKFRLSVLPPRLRRPAPGALAPATGASDDTHVGAFLNAIGPVLVLACFGCSERTQSYPGQFGAQPWLYPSLRAPQQQGAAAGSTAAAPNALEAEPGGPPKVSRSNGNFYDHYDVSGLFHELRISDEYPDASFTISFGVARIGFDKGPDGLACSSDVHVGRAFVEGAGYSDRDGNGRFESRSLFSAKHAEIVFENQWVPIANTLGGLKRGVVIGLPPDPRPDMQRGYVFKNGAWHRGSIFDEAPPGKPCRKITGPPPRGPRCTPPDGEDVCRHEPEFKIEPDDDGWRVSARLQGGPIVIHDTPHGASFEHPLGDLKIATEDGKLRRVEVRLGTNRYVDTDADGIFDEAKSANGTRPIPPN